ncbi:hypothetical protein OROHE_019247 [Orobanche hederae]
MADSKDNFSIYFHHGGKMVEDSGKLVYCGCDMTPNHGLDIDRFGYFDLIEEVNLLGYTTWDGLFYKTAKEKTEIKQISDDVSAMDMIKHSNHGQYPVHVYVDNGKKDVNVEHPNEVDVIEQSTEFEGGDEEFVEATTGALDGESIGESDSDCEDYMPVDVSESDDRVWQLTGVPCIHACSAIGFMKRDVADYVGECYTISVYIAAYQNALQPLNGRKMWPAATGTPIRPPPFRMMPGRPKKKRRRGAEEERQSGTKLKRFGLQMTCQKCLQTGHNKRSCANEAVEKPEKRKRGRPRIAGSKPRARQMAPLSERTSQSIPTNNQNASTSKALARDKTMARKGFGIHLGGETGKIYMRMPGENRVHFVAPTHVGSSSSSKITRGRREGRSNPVRGESGRIARKTIARDALRTQESVAK